MTLHEEALLAASTRLFDNGGVSEDGEMFAHEQVPVASAPLSFRVAERATGSERFTLESASSKAEETFRVTVEQRVPKAIVAST